MKSQLVISSLIAAVACVSPVMAETPAKPAAKAASEADMDKYYAAMQERYKKMQDQMARLRATKDPKERQKILEEHWSTMHDGMDMMMGRGGMGPGMMMGGMGMMGGGMGPGGKMGPQGGPGSMSPDMMMQRQQRMEQRMDMMQMMMDQMMQHQGMGGPAASGK